MKILYQICILSLFSVLHVTAQDPQLETNWAQPGSGSIECIKRDAERNLVYLGGNFPYFGQNVFYGAPVDTLNGIPNFNADQPNGTVYCAIPDGNGGWFIGGEFSRVGNIQHTNIARIDSSGHVASWNGNTNGTVRSLAINGNTLYVGGDFTQINGQNCKNLGSLNVNNGTLSSWRPEASATVYSICVAENKVFVGGTFLTVGGVQRRRLAALDFFGVLDTIWKPETNNKVLKLCVSGNTVYTAGTFTFVNGTAHKYIAAIDAQTGLLSSWDPAPDQSVNAITVHNNTIYVGGNFTTIGGAARKYIAAFDSATGLPTNWNPDLSGGGVEELKISGNTVYAGGSFANSGGLNRFFAAAFDLFTGQLKPWKPEPDKAVYTLAISGNRIYTGGLFTFEGGYFRRCIVALDGTTGQPTDWAPNPSGLVEGIALKNNIVYVGGNFISIGGKESYGLSAVDATTGLTTEWNPRSRFAQVRAMATYGDTLFVGGDSPSLFEAFSLVTGLPIPMPTSFFASQYIGIYTLEVAGDVLYIGGDIHQIDRQSREYAGAINILTGHVNNWNPTTDISVAAIGVKGNNVYMGGDFSTVGRQSRKNMALVDTATGALNAWDPRPNNRVKSFAMAGNTLFTGGYFDSIGVVPRKRLAAFDMETNTLQSWNPGIDGGYGTYCLLVENNKLFVGGLFTSVEGQARRSFAVFSLQCDPPSIPVISQTSPGICKGELTTLHIASGELNDAAEWRWYKNACGANSIGSGMSIDVSPDSTTDYFVRGEGGCVSGDCRSITIDVSVPSFDSIFVTACKSYTWNVSGETYFNSGVYPVQLMNTAGCDSTVKLHLSLTPIDTSVIKDEFEFSAASGYAYQWVNCDDQYSIIPGATDQYFTPLPNIQYAVIVRIGSCSDTSNCYSQTTVGDEMEDYISTFSCFPNPAIDQIIINGNFPGPRSIIIRIYGVDGVISQQMTCKLIVGNFTKRLDISSLSNGSYFLQIISSTGERMANIRFMVLK